MKQALLATFCFLAVCSPALAQETVTIRGNQLAEEIVVLRLAWSQLNREFEVRLKEVSDLSDRIEAASSEVEELQRRGSPATAESEAKVEAIVRMRVELSKKTDAYQEQWNRRTGEIVGPVAKSVEDAMLDFLAARGAKEVLDLDAGETAPPGTPDISKEFVAWFNARNKVSAPAPQ